MSSARYRTLEEALDLAGRLRVKISPECPLRADCVAKVAEGAGDDLDRACVIEVEHGICRCLALSHQFSRLCTDTFTP